MLELIKITRSKAALVYRLLCAASLLVCATGCEESSGNNATDTSSAADAADAADTSSTADTSTAEDSTTSDTTSEDAADLADATSTERFGGEALMHALAGLWSGAAGQTPLGTFPLMNMDLRAVDGFMLFARTDLDPDNSLRFAFSLETHGALDVLVFRNGGQFSGLDRDTRTTLESYDPATNTWRFCALDGGCGYVDAAWTLHSDTSLTLQVMVGGFQHLTWTANRVEERALPDAFPDPTPHPGDTPFPAMPSVEVAVSWADSMPQDGSVWIILSTTKCGFTGQSCESSRAISAPAPQGSTSATLRLDQVHPGPYFLNTILDRNGNIQTLVFPDSGDGIALPDKAVEVAPTGTTTTSNSVSITVP